MNLAVLGSAVELGLLYVLMTLGMLMSFRILDIPDLTADGSFTLGAVVSGIFTMAGHPVIGIIVAIGAGFLAGGTTAILQTKLKVQPMLAGILTMTGLYSINLMVTGNKANLSLLRTETVFTKFEKLTGLEDAGFALGLTISVMICLLLGLFFYTTLGLSIRATGDNEDMVRSSSIDIDAIKILGLGLANAFVATSGALLAQYQGFADIGGGTGMAVVGIASLIIGEIVVGVFCRKRSVSLNILGAFIGAVVYRVIIALALQFNGSISNIGWIKQFKTLEAVMQALTSASSMKLITALIVTLTISYPVIVAKIKLSRQMKRGRKHA